MMQCSMVRRYRFRRSDFSSIISVVEGLICFSWTCIQDKIVGFSEALYVFTSIHAAIPHKTRIFISATIKT